MKTAAGTAVLSNANVVGRRVVCAANRNKEGFIVCGARHYDGIMHSQIMHASTDWTINQVEQGFIDQRGIFMTREEAYEVARAAGQIIRDGGDGDEKLFSEHLY